MNSYKKAIIVKVTLRVVLFLCIADPLWLPSRTVAAENSDVALIEQMAKDSQIFRKCLSQLTPEELSKNLKIKHIPVRKEGEALIIVTPLTANPAPNCFLWGAHEPMVSVYRQVGPRYYLLMEPAAYGDIGLMKTYSNSYPDLKTTYPIHAGRSLNIDIYKFDGNRYVHKKNIIERNE
jgi:hypothetical protein